MSFENSNEDVIYEAVTDSKKRSFLVSLDQIYDIVGEEDWIHGESNCLIKFGFRSNNHAQLGSKKEGAQRVKYIFV